MRKIVATDFSTITCPPVSTAIYRMNAGQYVTEMERPGSNFTTYERKLKLSVLKPRNFTIRYFCILVCLIMVLGISNLISAGEAQYAYDDLGRLTTVIDDAAQRSTTTMR